VDRPDYSDARVLDRIDIDRENSLWNLPCGHAWAALDGASSHALGIAKARELDE
jgi:hypothetical protein